MEIRLPPKRRMPQKLGKSPTPSFPLSPGLPVRLPIPTVSLCICIQALSTNTLPYLTSRYGVGALPSNPQGAPLFFFPRPLASSDHLLPPFPFLPQITNPLPPLGHWMASHAEHIFNANVVSITCLSLSRVLVHGHCPRAPRDTRPSSNRPCLIGLATTA